VIDDEYDNSRRYPETSEEAVSQGEGGVVIRCRGAAPTVSLMLRCGVNSEGCGGAGFIWARRRVPGD